MENINTENNVNDENELQRVRREMTVLYEVSNAMRSTLELNSILYIILTGVTAHTGLGFNRAILFLVHENQRYLVPKMAIGPESGEHAHRIWDFISESDQHLDDLIDSSKMTTNIKQSKFFKSIKNLKISLNTEKENLLGYTFHTGMPIYITEDKINQYEDDEFFNYFKTNALVIMPLKANDKVNGLIVADNLFTQKPISDSDLRIFQMLANQAGLAIENSRLYEMVMRKSHMDSLTNLWNHGYFQSKISEVIDQNTDAKSSTTLMMIDIDNFKSLNDKYGHQYGDTVLKEIAQILKNYSREFDYPCRYGGEEFSMILSQTNIDQGFTIAERIRKEIVAHKFPQTPSKEKLTITVSIGIATYPLDANNKEDLIMQADKAMYKAKFSGKNQTFVD